MSKEEFRSFVSKNPDLAKHVASGKMSWQKFYEMYDLYGENSSVWNDYRSPNKVSELIKNVDVSSIKEHIASAQKALELVQELTAKTPNSQIKTPSTPRPLNKFFED